MRTFHVGGAASRSAAADGIHGKGAGTVRLHNIKTVRHHTQGNLVAVSRSGEVGIVDDHGRERERYKVPYGAAFAVEEGARITAGALLAKWDPNSHPIITEVAGFVKLQDLVEGVTVVREVDEATGLAKMVITDPKTRGSSGKDLRPTIRLVDETGKDVCFVGTNIPATYNLPAKSVVSVEDGQQLGVGDMVARLPVESSKTRDITGGLPRVADLFEARKPKDPAILAEASGVIRMGDSTKGKQRVKIVQADGSEVEILIPKWVTLNVFEGEGVEKGEVIADGELSAHDILRLRGTAAVAEYLVHEIQDVYRLQGVRINDKHIEVIIRQMLRKVEIAEPGDTRFLAGEMVEIHKVREANKKLLEEHGDTAHLARWNWVLQGITKASLSTESFISAASFQETTRVLTEAAVRGAKDDLRGLKENVIVGRLIPGGTGLAFHEQRKRARLNQFVNELDAVDALHAQVASGMSDMQAEMDALAAGVVEAV